MSREAEIRSREQAATGGPWGDRDGLLWLPHKDGRPGRFETGEGVVRDKDATFIAHARADIPWLLAELDMHRTRWQRLVNGFAGAFNNGAVPHSDAETIEWVLQGLTGKARELGETCAELGTARAEVEELRSTWEPPEDEEEVARKPRPC